MPVPRGPVCNDAVCAGLPKLTIRAAANIALPATPTRIAGPKILVGLSLFHLSNHLGNISVLLPNEGFVGAVIFVAVGTVIHRSKVVLLRPDEPVVDNCAGQQDPDTARDRGQHGEPPGPAVNAFHRGVKAHGPAPEQGRALGCGASIKDLLQLAVAAVTGHRQNGAAVHRKEQDRAIEEDNRKAVERIVIEVAVADRECGRPIQMREDAIRHSFGPAAHQDRPDQTQDQDQPQQRRKGIGQMLAHLVIMRQLPGPHPPGHTTDQKEHARDDERAAFIERWHAQPVFRAGRFQRQPEQLPDELRHRPADLRQHGKAHDVEPDHEADARDHTVRPDIDRADLSVAKEAKQLGEEGLACALCAQLTAVIHAPFGFALNLHLGEDILILNHDHIPPMGMGFAPQIGNSSHQFHHSGQPAVQTGPEMMMQTAEKNTAFSASK
mmetsp:Transcript_28311/g.52694  ORF Transcript_28311/g.52694 Transcript_28311/m.52694 type:complete len:438 (+) Transcript_28311:2514-3827(+)